MPQVAVLRDLCSSAFQAAQVSEYRDLWHQSSNRFENRARQFCTVLKYDVASYGTRKYRYFGATLCPPPSASPSGTSSATKRKTLPSPPFTPKECTKPSPT